MTRFLSLQAAVCLLVLTAWSTPAATNYVWQGSTSPTPPYASWATAAHVIQDAVDAAVGGDMVLVTNGVYDTGGKAVYSNMTNRVAVDKPLTLLSVNGAEFTVIKGYQVPVTTNGDGAIRCVYLTNGAFLSGFTLTDGATTTSNDLSKGRGGGGVWCESADAMASNCVLTGNSAHDVGGGAIDGTFDHCTFSNNSASTSGGGVYDSVLTSCTLAANSVTGNSFPTFGGGGAMLSTLSHCLLTGNSANSGGGAYNSTLDNCTLTGNLAEDGAGAYNSTLDNCTLAGNLATETGGGSRNSSLINCIVYFNGAPNDANHRGGSLDYCATTPMPTTGTGNITNTPLFVDTNDWIDLRLQSNSPCINAGNNTSITTTSDLDGNPRIQGGTADMGAYEYQSPSSVISYAWLQQYGLPTDGSVDFVDGDGDKANTWGEWKMWTIPTNQLSVLRLLNLESQTNGTTVRWLSVTNHSYQLERTTNLATSFTSLQSNIVGQAGTTAYTDTTTANSDSFFYRVSVLE